MLYRTEVGKLAVLARATGCNRVVRKMKAGKSLKGIGGGQPDFTLIEVQPERVCSIF
jgi:hypothetical protein